MIKPMCEYCGKPISEGEDMVFTMNRNPPMWWHRKVCFDADVKPFDLKTITREVVTLPRSDSELRTVRARRRTPDEA